MIEFVQGNIFDADVDALVNPVNCVGIMGKGLALQFKHVFPDNYAAYKAACDRNKLHTGQMFLLSTGAKCKPYYIINFPTKEHWRDGSDLKYIKTGLLALKKVLFDSYIYSVAIPPLGCGLGGLKWADVKGEIINVFGNISAVTVFVYEPKKFE